MENKNYYDILGVSVKATLDEITAAKNLLAKRYHPDVNMKLGVDTTEQMQEILEAYRILSDPKKRSEYDREITGRTAVMQPSTCVMRRNPRRIVPLLLLHTGRLPARCTILL